ncbi:uncharacterized protein LOC123440930 isoform X4 [Hordeum vulgare subsp. vulgare]|uniref:uncharacterized protein LOC123440930 isoform X4 n=1 Tax=Hordeum vulgare subsp. vulgare TaxID=112509 RepID=UPI001D1A339B|nr:uncharacterized protein LOC123440930 isoform X4 [Hordeum vulgare subsp. vulgare]
MISMDGDSSKSGLKFLTETMVNGVRNHLTGDQEILRATADPAPGPLCGCSYSSLFHSINLLDQHSREESPTVDTDNKSRAPQPTADQHSREVQIDPISWDFHSSGRRDTTGGKQHGSSSCGELQGVNLSQSKHRINGCLRGAEEL